MLSLLSCVGNWYKTYYTTGRPTPLITHIVLSNICNFDCSFCFLEPEQKRFTLPLDKFSSLVKDLKSLGTYYLYISGGEPLLVKNISKYLTLAKKYVPYVHVVTNGSLLDRANAEMLAKSGIDEVSVSLDAMEQTHNKYRRNSKAFAGVLNAVKMLKQYAPGIKITCGTVIAPWNVSEQKDLYNLCRSLKVEQRHQAIQEYPVVIQKQGGKSLITHAFVSELQAFIKSLPPGQCDLYLRLQLEYFSHLLDNTALKHPIFNKPCILPYFYVNILGSGEVGPCYGVKSNLYPGTGYIDPPKEFNIFHTSLTEIFNSDDYTQMACDLKTCKECRRYFASCYNRPRLSFPLGAWLQARMGL